MGLSAAPKNTAAEAEHGGFAGPIRPVQAACAPDDAARDGKCLSNRQIQAIFASACTPFGECLMDARE